MPPKKTPTTDQILVDAISALREDVKESHDTVRAQHELLTKEISKLTSWQDKQNDNITRFWQHDWPKLTSNVEATSARVVGLEKDVHALSSGFKAIEKTVADHEIRLRAVEANGLRLAAIASTVSAVVGLAVPLLFKVVVSALGG